ncbi:E3 ubiquitin-protein ligase TRIM32-like [Branchiostoma lanceolatum]|uniref:E3 ubiquitin-protein ligase TRIM32-like n=1 Tax=Branchiostoma lanceolatum TaxID=7740 RepID=UPI0034570224
MSKQGVKRYFSFIKNRVSSDWKDLAWHLDFDTPDIQNIDGKHRDDKSRCMDLLQQWYKQKGNAATIHVLIKALQDAELQHVVDSLKDNYPDPVLPVHLHLGLAKQTSAQGQARDISEERREQIRERILEVERALFTVEVLNDPVRYREVRKIFNKHKALLKRALKGSIILLLTFLRQTDVDRFYHNHYRVGEGTLSQQLSHILISDHLQDKVKGAQLIVRLQVKHEDYVRVRDRLGQGLDRTTSVDNLLDLPPPSRHVDCSSLRSLDLAVIGREDEPCTDRTDDINMWYRQVQSAIQTTREKSKQAEKVQLQMTQGQVLTGRQGVDAVRKEEGVKMLKEKDEKAEKILLELKEKIQQLKETNMSKDAKIEELLTAEQTTRERLQGQLIKGRQVVDAMKEEVTMLKKKDEESEKIHLGARVEKLLTAEQTTREKEVKMLKEKNRKAQKIFLEQKAEMNEKIQQLHETNKNMAAIIEELLIAKAKNTEQVEQSVVKPKGRDTGLNVRSIKVGQPWVRKVIFGGEGSSREFNDPMGATVSQHNELYIVDCWKRKILVFTMDGVYIREFTTSLPGEIGQKFEPHDVAVDRNDNLWVVGCDHVVQYSREGTCLANIHIDLPGVTYFRSITVDMGTEQVIVTEYDGKNGQLLVFNQGGSKVGTYGSGHRSPKPWWPQYVTVDGKGNILVTDINNHCVHVLDRQGNFKFRFGSEGSDESQLRYPEGICVNGMGNIIVADSGNGCVKMFDSQGRFLHHIGSGTDGPHALAVSPGGDVVVTDWEDETISVWSQRKAGI